jgi:hypothetical protein
VGAGSKADKSAMSARVSISLVELVSNWMFMFAFRIW